MAVSVRFWAYLALAVVSHYAVITTNAESIINNKSVPRRLPFLLQLKPYKSAKKAYLEHLQQELEKAQRDLYTSQKTCVALRKRFEDQRKEALAQIRSPAVSEADAISREEDKATIQFQDEEIKKLRNQIKIEAEKFKDQVEQMRLLKAELEEVQQWKETQTESNLSEHKQNEYEQQIDMLSLKLEAAEFAAKTRSETGKSDIQAGRRSQQLQVELDNLCTKYAKLSIQLAKASVGTEKENGEEIAEQHQQLEREMDQAIQSAVQVALNSVENEWEEKYQALQQKLANITHHSEIIQVERDEALSNLQESLSNDQQPNLQEKLTVELTEKITLQLTEELTSKLEKRYKKKYKKLQKEAQSKASGEDHQKLLQAEVEKVKEQCESEYTVRLQQMKGQHQEELELQKEKMRKLVRALLEREAKEKGTQKSKVEYNSKDSEGNTGDNMPKKSRMQEEGTVGSDHEVIASSTSLKTTKKRRKQVPVRGNSMK